jgi:hypothetical protein
MEILKSTNKDAPPYWMPLLWASHVFELARREDRIKDDHALGLLSTDLVKFRDACSKTLQVDLIGIPLAYSQVLASYVF